MGPVLDRDRAGEAQKPSLGRAVGGVAESHKAVDRGNVDDGPFASRDHARQHRSGHQPSRAQRDRQLGIPVRGLGGGQGRLRGMGGVVDQHVQRSEHALGFGYQPGAGVVRDDVGDQRQPAHLACHRLRRLGIAIDNRDHGTLPGQAQRGSATDAPTSAGDQDDATLEPHGTLHASQRIAHAAQRGQSPMPVIVESDALNPGELERLGRGHGVGTAGQVRVRRAQDGIEPGLWAHAPTDIEEVRGDSGRTWLIGADLEPVGGLGEHREIAAFHPAARAWPLDRGDDPQLGRPRDRGAHLGHELGNAAAAPMQEGCPIRVRHQIAEQPIAGASLVEIMVTGEPALDRRGAASAQGFGVDARPTGRSQG